MYQGDPLSPLLFNLVVEVLHVLLVKGQEVGVFCGIKINSFGYTISHLQYADDTVIFVNNGTSSIEGIKSIIYIFQMLSGLRINFDKSFLYGYSKIREDMLMWAGILGCKIGLGILPI